MTEDEKARLERERKLMALYPDEAASAHEQEAIEASKDGSDKLLMRLRTCHKHGYGDYPNAPRPHLEEMP